MKKHARDPRLGALFGLIARPDARSFRGFVHFCRPFGSLALPDWAAKWRQTHLPSAICYLSLPRSGRSPTGRLALVLQSPAQPDDGGSEAALHGFPPFPITAF